MLTFEEWYKSNYPDLDPDADDLYEQFKECYTHGYNYGVWMTLVDGPEL
jgi:hypothetical protein